MSLSRNRTSIEILNFQAYYFLNFCVIQVAFVQAIADLAKQYSSALLSPDQGCQYDQVPTHNMYDTALFTLLDCGFKVSP
jgi:hypothetical protein